MKTNYIKTDLAAAAEFSREFLPQVGFLLKSSRHCEIVPLFSRPTLLLENYQPWLDLKVHSKVDASVAEVRRHGGGLCVQLSVKPSCNGFRFRPAGV